MRELYNEFFFIPKHGKISEKVMLTRVATTIVTIVMCLIAMSVTAYAYFSHNITSGLSTVQAAKFETEVLITDNNSNSSIAVTKAGKIQTANLPTGTYTVKLSKGESTAQTGFCIVTIDGAKYYTSQIGVDVARSSTEPNDVTFTVVVPENKTVEIGILSHWGTCSVYASSESNPKYIGNGNNPQLDLTPNTLGLGDPSGEDSSAGEDEAKTQDTTPSTSTNKKLQTTTTKPATTTAPSTTTEPSTTTVPSTTTIPTTTTVPSTTSESSTATSNAAESPSNETTDATGTDPKSSAENSEGSDPSAADDH